MEVGEIISEAVCNTGCYNSVFFEWDGRLMVDKREETSLVPEIELHNKLKYVPRALVLPLLSIH